MAHGAAISIFEFILNNNDLRGSLVGVPFYFHVMISFAGHFLLSCSQYREQLSIDVGSNLNLLGNVIQLFKSIPCISHNPLQKMAAALERRHFECQTIVDRYKGLASANNTQHGSNQINVNQWNNSIPTTNSGTSNGGYRNDHDARMSSLHHAMDVGSTSAHLGQIADGFGTVSPNGDTTLDMVFQDFGGFDFPDLQINFAPQ